MLGSEENQGGFDSFDLSEPLLPLRAFASHEEMSGKASGESMTGMSIVVASAPVVTLGGAGVFLVDRVLDVLQRSPGVEGVGDEAAPCVRRGCVSGDPVWRGV